MTSAIGAPPADVGELEAALARVAEMPATVIGAGDAGQTATTLDVGAAIVLIAAAGLFAVIARRVTTKESQPFDDGVRRFAQSHRTRLIDAATKPVTLLSMPLLVVSATAALVWYLKHDDRDEAALAVGITPLVAAAMGQSFTTCLEQRDPPDAGTESNGKPPAASFPSGHTTGVTAEALGIAYVLIREGLASPATVASLVAWPLVVGVTRLYRDRHWASDVLAGWVTGTGVAALSVLLYEWRRRSAARTASTQG